MGFEEQEARQRSRLYHDIGFNTFHIVHEARRLMTAVIQERSTKRFRVFLGRIKEIIGDIEDMVEELEKVE